MNTSKGKRNFCLCIILIALLYADIFAQKRDYTIEARLTTGIKIDGRIDEEWSSADVAKNFVQREPGYPAAATLPSEVRVLFDNDALYLGYMLYDTAPDSVKGQIQRRDNDGSSDFVDLYLDTFHDGRNGYWFTLTAAGVQAEGNFFNEQELSASWDAVWQSAVASTDSGWSCEMRIPFHVLRHAGGRDDGWGIAFARRILRKNEAGFWPPVNPEIGWKASNIGTLVGLKDIASSSHVEILPHVVGRWDAPSDEKWASKNEWENLGLSVKLVPTADLTVDLAYQPDFAQVDVDDEVINLSDYPVYLEEKRPFFLESNELFAETPFRLFYSRRVADPDYGGRLNFQKGKVRATLLAGKNRAPGDLMQSVSAGRVTYNLGDRHRLGTTYTFLDQTGYRASAGALDARFRWRTVDMFALWFAAVQRGVPSATQNDRQPVETRAAYYRDFGPAKAQAKAAYRGTDYDVNDMGFSDPSNSIEKELWIGDTYWQSSGLFRYRGFNLTLVHETFADGSHANGDIEAELFGQLRNNWEFNFGSEFGDTWRRNYEAIIPTERDNFGHFAPEYYRYFWHWLNLYTDQTKKLYGGFSSHYGAFRDGNAFGFDPSASWRPRSNIEISPKFTWRQIWDTDSYVDSSGNHVVANIRYWTLKTTWTPHLNLSFRGTLIYADQEWSLQDKNRLYANLLLSYNWSPGSWFYLVYDEAYRDTDPLADSRPGDRTLRAKLTYFFVAP